MKLVEKVNKMKGLAKKVISFGLEKLNLVKI